MTPLTFKNRGHQYCTGLKITRVPVKLQKPAQYWYI